MSYTEHLAAAERIQREGFRCKPINNFGRYGVKVWESGTPRMIWTKREVADFLGAADWAALFV